MAHCNLCKKSFMIDKCGVSQVDSHSRGAIHKAHKKSCQNQLTFTSSKAALQLSSGKLVLSTEELVRKAETLNALHFLEFNLSYSSSTQQSVLFKVMFPNSNIAQSFTLCATKMAYIIKYRLGDFFKTFVKR